jgi:hypothetical protein
MRRLWLLIAVLALTSCGGGSGNLAIVGSSPSTVGLGPQRLLMAEVDPASSAFVGGPDEDVTVTFTGPSGAEQTVAAEWVWSIEGVRGFLVARPEFGEAGQWTVAITSPRGTTGETAFSVGADIPIPEVGEPVPASETRTSPEFELGSITTDPDPEPSFYEITVAEAISNGTPALIVFATPAFCQTAVCGPTMEIVKEAVGSRTGFDVVHVEIFENVDSEGEGRLIEVPAVIEWGLPSEPWVYVVDADGIATARFEGAVSPEELGAALDALG